MKRQTITTDWGALLDDLMGKGIRFTDLKKTVGIDISYRMLMYYRLGRQPTHWVGERMIEYWCEVMQKPREKLPKREHERGVMVKHEGPRIQDVRQLADWIEPTQKERGKPGRKAKVKAEVA